MAEALCHPADMAAVRSHETCKHVCLRPLDDGAVLNLGSRRLRVMHTPGHTKGSVCLLDEENGILFAGDTVSYGPVFMAGARRDMRRYLATLKRLRDAGAYRTLYCCHNTCPIGAGALDALIACVEGVLAGTLTGVPSSIPVSDAAQPRLAAVGRCSILFE